GQTTASRSTTRSFRRAPGTSPATATAGRTTASRSAARSRGTSGGGTPSSPPPAPCWPSPPRGGVTPSPPSRTARPPPAASAQPSQRTLVLPSSTGELLTAPLDSPDVELGGTRAPAPPHHPVPTTTAHSGRIGKRACWPPERVPKLWPAACASS